MNVSSSQKIFQYHEGADAVLFGFFDSLDMRSQSFVCTKYFPYPLIARYRAHGLLVGDQA
jgi:hypothetical protein